MSNQMRRAVLIGFFMSVLSLCVSLVLVFVSGEFVSVYTWISIGMSVVVSIILISLYILAKQEEKELRAKIAYYKLVHALREKALLDFYKRFKIAPQYSKDGKLLTPDELLSILTKLTAEGKLDDSVYEQLGILPRFDKNGKEIPRIMVLKHLLRSIKKDNVKDIKKLQGLHKPGPEKKAEDKKDKPKAPEKKEEAKSGGGKSEGGGQNKIDIFAAKVIVPEYKSQKKDDKSKGDASKSAEVKKAGETSLDTNKNEAVAGEEVNKNESITASATSDKNKSSYLNRMWETKSENKENAENVPVGTVQSIEEYGEGTFE